MRTDKLKGQLRPEQHYPVSLSQVAQKQKLSRTIEEIKNFTGPSSNASRVSVQGNANGPQQLTHCADCKPVDVYDKDLVAILHLLVALVDHFKVSIQLPANLSVKVIVIQVSVIHSYFQQAFGSWRRN